jgi:hypothetical protein
VSFPLTNSAPLETPSPAERFATTLRWLSQSVAAMSGGDRLSYLLIGMIIDRIRGIKQRVARFAARIGAGRYAPRCSRPPRPRWPDRSGRSAGCCGSARRTSRPGRQNPARHGRQTLPRPSRHRHRHRL